MTHVSQFVSWNGHPKTGTRNTRLIAEHRNGNRSVHWCIDGPVAYARVAPKSPPLWFIISVIRIAEE